VKAPSLNHISKSRCGGTRLHPNEIDPAEAQAKLNRSQEMWDEAGDDVDKYDDANALARVAEEKIASSQGKH
jgi:F-type H+-transporting ATPase subunit epsilon